MSRSHVTVSLHSWQNLGSEEKREQQGGVQALLKLLESEGSSEPTQNPPPEPLASGAASGEVPD